MADKSAPYDVVVIGGGITGAGVARDCAMRGLKTLVLEKSEPGRATTAASTHLIHGGLRYLLYDRLTTHATCWDSGHILRLAGPMLRRLPIIWPVYGGHAHGLETVETLLEEYDPFQAMKGGKPHLRLSRQAMLDQLPGLAPEGLLGGICFDEWWVDPVGLVAKNLASAKRHGAVLQNHAGVTALLRRVGRVEGVIAGGEEIRARLVVNASGPWIGRTAGLAGIQIPLRLRQGTHLLYKKKLVPMGLLLEAVDRGRSIFVIPSPEGTLVGPTDIPAPDDPDAARSSKEEVQYLLASVKRYFPNFPQAYDALTLGIRPILGQAGDEKLLSREFEVFDHARRDAVAGLLTIGGGKMSDFRLMAEATTDEACRLLGRQEPCRTHEETLEGAPIHDIPHYHLPYAGLKAFLKKHPRLRHLHALSHLGLAYAKHWSRRRMKPGEEITTASDLLAYYSQ
ncbi:MAG: FAD-dependent oxidoreductase [Elusimicrobia bacterium]|nr:FAD-dependent oxidoreductase [Elusimicrobiota bacterium]